MKKSCSVIYNPITSGFNERKLDKICSVLTELYEVEKLRSEYAGHTVSLAEEANQNSDLVISYGGDGTFGEVVKGIFLAEQKAVISHIPIGTANDLKRNFKLSKDPIKSAQLIMNGKEQNLDIFTLNGVPFSYVAAGGYLANVPCNTPIDLKRHLKYMAYMITGIQEYRETSPKIYNIDCITDQKRFKESVIDIIITNSLGFGGMNLFNNVLLDDGYFEVTLIKNMTKLDMLKIAKNVVNGKFDLNNYPDLIRHFKTSYLSLSLAGGNTFDRPFDVDGDSCPTMVGKSALEIKKERVVRMLLPPR